MSRRHVRLQTLLATTVGMATIAALGVPLGAQSPSITINNVSVTEGNSGTTAANFTVSLSAAASGTVTVNFGTADGTGTASVTTTNLSNSAVISIPSTVGAASPYPSNITVPSGLGSIYKVTATLTGYGHEWPDDVDVLLVGPGGQTVILMSDAGGGFQVSGLSLTFDDDAATSMTTSTPTSGTYKPTNLAIGGTDSWPSPAPAGSGTALSVFNGLDPAGIWKLYVADDVDQLLGTISGGWSLSFQMSGTSGDYMAQRGTVTFTSGQSSQTISVVVNGDSTNESSETFTVNLSSASGGTITDAQGVGTISNDDGAAFTDPTLSAGSSTIKAVHITELRTRINAIRSARGMSAYSFTDSTLTAGSTGIKAVHILELRTALAEAYSNAGLTQPTYSGTTPAAGVAVTAAVITELRAAALAIEYQP